MNRDDNLQSIRQEIFPTWLFISLVFVYGYYFINSTLRTFLGFSMTRMMSSLGEFGSIFNWSIFSLKTGLTLWLFYCLYKGLKRLDN